MGLHPHALSELRFRRTLNFATLCERCCCCCSNQVLHRVWRADMGGYCGSAPPLKHGFSQAPKISATVGFAALETAASATVLLRLLPAATSMATTAPSNASKATANPPASASVPAPPTAAAGSAGTAGGTAAAECLGRFGGFSAALPADEALLFGAGIEWTRLAVADIAAAVADIVAAVVAEAAAKHAEEEVTAAEKSAQGRGLTGCIPRVAVHSSAFSRSRTTGHV